MANVTCVTKKDLAAVKPCSSWQTTGITNWWFPLKGEIREAWGLGSIWKTCCGTIYGMYFDEESNKYVVMYLGKDEEAAVGRVNHVKSFTM